MHNSTVEYEVQAQPRDTDVWHLSGRFPTFEEAEAQAIASANEPRELLRAFRIVKVETRRTALPPEYLVVQHPTLHTTPGHTEPEETCELCNPS